MKKKCLYAQEINLVETLTVTDYEIGITKEDDYYIYLNVVDYNKTKIINKSIIEKNKENLSDFIYKELDIFLNEEDMLMSKNQKKRLSNKFAELCK